MKAPTLHQADQGLRSHQGGLGESLGSSRKGRWANGVPFLFVFKDVEESKPTLKRHPQPSAPTIKWLDDEERSFR